MGKRIFIFGEDGFLNSALIAFMNSYGHEVVGSQSDRELAFALISQHIPEVVLLHIESGHLLGLELAKDLRKKFPTMGLILIARSEDIRIYGVRRDQLPIGLMICSIAKKDDLTNLAKSIEKAKGLSRTRIEINQLSNLTDSQIETLLLLADGLINAEIARMRFVSEKSVEQMLARIATLNGISFDHKQNSRIKLLNYYYEISNGRN